VSHQNTKTTTSTTGTPTRNVLTGCFSSIVCGNHLFADLTDVQFSLTCPLSRQLNSTLRQLPPLYFFFFPEVRNRWFLYLYLEYLVSCQVFRLLIENVRRTLKKTSRNWTTKPPNFPVFDLIFTPWSSGDTISHRYN